MSRILRVTERILLINDARPLLELTWLTHLTTTRRRGRATRSTSKTIHAPWTWVLRTRPATGAYVSNWQVQVTVRTLNPSTLSRHGARNNLASVRAISLPLALARALSVSPG